MTSRLLVDKIEGKTTSGTIQMPSGHVIQTVTGASTSEMSFNNSSFVATPTNLSITPKFSTSKILIMFSASLYANGEAQHAIATVFRETGTASSQAVISGTNLNSSSAWGFGSVHGDTSGNTMSNMGGNISGMVEDDPSTTSALRYTIAVRNHLSGTNYFSVNSMKATLVAQEIAQ
jgi:hypothetical protein